MSHTQPKKYRKKPVEIEAMQWDGTAYEDLQRWTRNKFQPLHPDDRIDDPDWTAEVFVDANGVWVGVEDGEWIIKDGRGFYPCKPDIFEATYEAATHD